MNLEDLAEKAKAYQAQDAGIVHEVRVCMAASCQSSGASAVLEALEQVQARPFESVHERLAEPGQTPGEAHRPCKIKRVGCMGLCSAGPLVAIAAPGAELNAAILYRGVQPEDAPAILASVGALQWWLFRRWRWL